MVTSLRPTARVALLLIPLAVAGCVRPSAPPAPPPEAAPPPRPVPAPPPPPVAADWRDWPQAPGDWSYSRGAQGSTARYAQAGSSAVATIRCEPGAGRVVLSRAGQGANSLTIRTSSTVRSLPVEAAAPGVVTATVAADDRLLDAMIYSRGRFTMEAAPLPPLSLPAWAEVARVVEDCRG